MVSALIKGKSEVEEDKVTSSVFDNILHLPDEMVWKIIRHSCYDYSLLPVNAGSLLFHEFWPHWDKEKTENKYFVEPDLFLQFEYIDIIIEAKRENNKQERNQWERETQAYYNEYGEANKKVILLAIDGVNDENNEIIKLNENLTVNVIKTRWTNIFIVVKKCLNEISNNKFNNLSDTNRILSLIKDFLIYYGYSEKIWFYEIFKKEISLTNIYDSFALLSNSYKDNTDSDNVWFNTLFNGHCHINYDKCIKHLRKVGV